MKRSRLAALGAALLVLATVLHLGFRGYGTIPPLGVLLDPVRGAWAAPALRELPLNDSIAISGLSGPVEIRYDVRGVPHIFGATEEDVIAALGFAVARDRLFQLEMQARAGAGTLTELFGPRALPADEETRSIGLPRAAEQTWAALADTSTSKRLARAYARGINAWIDGLSLAQRPVEYKMLGVAPSRWEPINTLHLFSRMGYTLTYTFGEMTRLAAEAMVGKDAAQALFPVNSPIQEPIQPNGAGAARFDAVKFPLPASTDSGSVALLPDWAERQLLESDDGIRRIFASNNWAVAPSRSLSRNALLAGDPHLELTLPSIWYEAHLVVPGELDVYGVSLPGGPGITIGFNRDVAWSLTNTSADVIDFYRETVDNHANPVKHLVDGVWRDLTMREEVYHDQKGKVIRIDTVRYSFRGPLVRLSTDWLSMRWTMLEPADITRAFSQAGRAASVTQLLDAFAADFYAPAQNVIAADRQGNIGIRSTGHFPIRPGNGDGLTIRDGSVSANDWQGYWPVSQYPQSINPPQGFLASANQQPIDPARNPRYLGYEWGYEPWRALQINRLLRESAAVTVDDMRRFQTDPGSVRADRFVPYFLTAAAGRRTNGTSLRRADSVLSRWDRKYTKDNSAAVLFEAAMSELYRRTWDELIPPNDSLRRVMPSSAILLTLLSDPVSAWWDDKRTADRREDRDAILADALAAAFDTTVRRYGEPNENAWSWSRTGGAAVNHLLRFEGFSRRNIPVQGGRGTLNPSAQRTGHGASWRMVVELGTRVRGIGTYPGGQSGNPASTRYDDRLRFWSNGELELLYMPAALDSVAPAQVRASLSVFPLADSTGGVEP